jgi:hypothetical protein
MRAVVLVPAVLAALVLSPHASAKGCLRIQAPASAEVGESVRLSVRTYMSRLANGRVVPGAPTSLGIARLRMTAEGPDGRRFQFVARATAEDGVLVARVVLRATGLWRLSAMNWADAPRSCAASRLVRVRS